MIKKTGTAKEVATILRDAASAVTPRQFEQIAAYTLQDNSPLEVEAVTCYLPPNLRKLMPKKWLH